MSGFDEGAMSDPATDGQLRFLTVVNADIVGSTAALQDLDVEDAREVLYRAIKRMTDAIHKEGGTVVSVQGDGVLAAFGADIAREDDTERCCRAAIDIVEAFKSATESKLGGRSLGVRIGIHAGDVLLHRTFSDHGNWRDLTGLTVHIAAKLQQATEPNTVAVSTDAMSLLRSPVTAGAPKQLGALDGEDAIEYCTIRSIAADRSETSQEQHADAARIFGRDEILNGFSRNLAARGPAFPSYRFLGVAGVGKSRLCAEIESLAAASHVIAVRVKGEHSARNNSYAAMIPAIASALDLRLPISPEKLDTVVSSSAALKDHANGLRDLLGVPGLDKTYLRERPSFRNDAINQAIAASFLDLLSRHADGILIVVEDVDQLDSFSFDVLVDLQRELAGKSAIFVVTSRPDGQHRLEQFDGNLEQLEPLSDVDARKLVAEINSDLSADESALEKMVSLASGIPLILRAYAQTYQRSGVGRGKSLSINLKASTQIRLERLSEPAQKLAELLSISSGGLEREVCEKIFEAGVDMDALASELISSGLAETGGGRFLNLQHALLGEACASTILKNRKVELHRDIWRALAATAQKPLPLDRLAHHARNARDFYPALQYYWEACKREVQRASLPAITAIYDQAEAICEDIGSEADEHFARFALLTFDSFQQRGIMGELLSRMERVVEIARAQDNVLFECQALGHASMIDWFFARHKQAFSKAEQARAIAKTADIHPISAYAQYMMASAMQGNGEIKAAIALHIELIEQIENNPVLLKSGAIRNTVFVSHSLAVWCMAQSGEFKRAERILMRARSLAEGSEYPFGHVMLNAASGLLHHVQANYVEAEKSFRECMRLCRDEDVNAMEAFAVAHLARSMSRLGNPEAALDLIQDGYDRQIDEICAKCCIVYLHMAHAETLTLLGKKEAAI